MDYQSCIDYSTNINELRRIASAYVEDSRRLDLNELKASIKKTKGQYISYENVCKQLDKLKLDQNPVVRIIVPIFLQNYLLDQDEFISPCKITEDEIIKYEQSIIDESNNFDFKNNIKNFDLLKFILDKAWEHENSISVDEKNLIDEIRKYLNISIKEQNILEAKSSRYPTIGNILHNRSEIDTVRKSLQSSGLLFYIKNSENIACDVIPNEIAYCLRKYYNIEIKSYGYKLLVDYVTKIAKKQYLIDIVEKNNDVSDNIKISIPQNPTIQDLQSAIIEYVKPSNLLGGFSARDGLNITLLSKWCGDLGINVSGSKDALIKRILEHYDGLREIITSNNDEREKYYNVYHELACRDIAFLRKNNIITKDLECEHYFEKATNYLFEKKLNNKPLVLNGTNHADGKLSYNNKYILWDNKSKESEVNLKDHINQFDDYIRNSDKQVSVFMVIGPSFTANSIKECIQYSLKSDTQILLITADELKSVAELWNKKHPDEIFNLGLFKQNGRFNNELMLL